MFENTVSLGNLLTIAGFIVFITMYIVSATNAAKLINVRLKQIDISIEEFKEEVKELQSVITVQTVQNVRLDTMDNRDMATGKRLDELQKNFDSWTRDIYDARHTVLAERVTKLEARLNHSGAR